MEKDFDGWNETKKQIHGRHDAPFYHERELWWCTLGVNVGFERMDQEASIVVRFSY